MKLLIPFIPLLYIFIAVVYGRFMYLRHTWKYAHGDEVPSAFFFGLFWPVAMFAQFALFIGTSLHNKTPGK